MAALLDSGIVRVLGGLVSLHLCACGLSPDARLDAPSEAPVREGLNDRFLDPELQVDEWMQRFEVESREIAAQRAVIVGLMGLQSGSSIADIGAGTGLFMEPFSDAVGAGGKVYGVEISPAFVEHLSRRSESEGRANFEAVPCSERDSHLPPSSVDTIFICDTYHHFTYPMTTLNSLRRALRPGGHRYLVDFERIPGVSREWILGHVRAGKEVFRSEVEAAGFTFEQELEAGLKENYMLKFSR